MKARSVIMFLGCLVGGIIGLGYWYTSSGFSGNPKIDSNLSSVLMYGVFIGFFLADLLTQGMANKQA